MKLFNLIVVFTVLTSLNGFSQVKFPIKYRVEKQSMSTPMTDLDEVIFLHPYFTRPVNIAFDGSKLNMYYDNGESFTKMNVTEVSYDADYSGDELNTETRIFTNNSNVSDTIMFVIDYNVGYVQVVLPSKNAKGDYVGYTSYQEFVSDEKLAFK